MNNFLSWMKTNNNPKYDDETALIGYMIQYLSKQRVDWELVIPFYDEKFNTDKLYFWLKNQIELIEK